MNDAFVPVDSRVGGLAARTRCSALPESRTVIAHLRDMVAWERFSQGKCKRAFTLLELLAVLTVIALVAAITVPRLGGIHSRMAYETALSDLIRMDRQTRDLASKSQTKVLLRVDVSRNRLWYELEGEPTGVALPLPQSANIERFLSAREQKTSGEATVSFDTYGGSESYAIGLESGSGSSRWLLFAGTSGQLTQFDSRRDVEKIFDQLKQ